MLFDKAKTRLVKYPEKKVKVATYTIPASVTTIEDQAFGDCSNIGTLVIPRGVTEIRKNAFFNYTGTFRVEPSNARYTFDNGALVDKNGDVLWGRPVKLLQ